MIKRTICFLFVLFVSACETSDQTYNEVGIRPPTQEAPMALRLPKAYQLTAVNPHQHRLSVPVVLLQNGKDYIIQFVGLAIRWEGGVRSSNMFFWEREPRCQETEDDYSNITFMLSDDFTRFIGVGDVEMTCDGNHVREAFTYSAWEIKDWRAQAYIEDAENWKPSNSIDGHRH